MRVRIYFSAKKWQKVIASPTKSGELNFAALLGRESGGGERSGKTGGGKVKNSTSNSLSTTGFLVVPFLANESSMLLVLNFNRSPPSSVVRRRRYASSDLVFPRVLWDAFASVL